MSDNTDAISDWSKWIIGVSLFSASGCLSVLMSVGVRKANIINIKMAIMFFLLTILIAWIVQFIIVLRKNYDLNKSDSENEILFFSYSTLRKLLRTFIVLEMPMFIASLFYLTVWKWSFLPRMKLHLLQSYTPQIKQICSLKNRTLKWVTQEKYNWNIRAKFIK